MSIEAMKLWLKALETSWYHVGTFCPTDAAIELYDEARDSLRQAIEQAQKQEPVAWMYSDDHERMLETETFCTVYSIKVGSPDKGVTDVPLYTTPPQRQPLTDEQWQEIANLTGCLRIEKRGRDAIMRILDEAAHGIKGEA